MCTFFEVSCALSCFPKNVTGTFCVSRAQICDFCHGQNKNCHGHFWGSKLSRALFRVTGTFSRFFEKVSRAKKNVTGNFFQKCHGQLFAHVTGTFNKFRKMSRALSKHVTGKFFEIFLCTQIHRLQSPF